MAGPPPPPLPPPPPPPPLPTSTSTSTSTSTASTSQHDHNPNNQQPGEKPPPHHITQTIALEIPSDPPHPNSVLVSLLVHNGWPFADHWEYFVADPDGHGPDGRVRRGVVVLAGGDVRVGFWLEVKRGWQLPSQLEVAGRLKVVRLGWVGGGYFQGGGGLGEEGGGGHGREGGGGGDARGVGGEDEGVKGVFEGGRNREVVVEGVPRCEFERILFKVPAPEKTLRAVNGDLGEPGKRTRITQRNCQTWVVESAEQLVKEGIFEQRVVDYLRATSIMT